MKSPVPTLRLLLLFLFLVGITYLLWLGSLAIFGMREAKALRALEAEFQIFEQQFHEPSRVAAFLSAPLRRIDPDGFKRRSKLTLYSLSTPDEPKSLENLRAFTEVENLTLHGAFSPQHLAPLRKLPHLRHLEITGSFNGDLRMLEGQPLKSLRVSAKIDGDLQLPRGLPLRSLHIRCRVQSDLDVLEGLDLQSLGLQVDKPLTPAGRDRIAANTSLTVLYLSGSAVDAELLAALAVLPRLTSLSLAPCPPDLSELHSLPVMDSLVLEDVSMPALRTLAGQRNLRALEIGGAAFADEELPELLDQLPSLTNLLLSPECHRLSMAAVDGIRSRGVKVSGFWGATDYRLEDNFFLFEEGRYWAINRAASEASMWVDADTGQLGSRLSVETDDPYGADSCNDPTANSPNFLFDVAAQPGIGGQVSTNVVDEEESYIYFCTGTGAFHHSLTLLSLEKHELHLQWRFGYSWSKPKSPFLVDVRLPITSVSVKSRSKDLSEAEARRALHRHLLPGTFPRSVKLDERTWVFWP